ncbi:MAG: YraN family protein [Lentisphaerae bacterium]|nr:YraN family protein [Lentisphaerota bacterium]
MSWECQDTGEWGEKLAAKMLRRKRYRILGRRVKVGNRDEIDIIARNGEMLVFVEVKTRKTEAYGSPASAVDKWKRHTLSRAAVRYLKKLRVPNVCFRFDVVEVIGNPDDGEPELRHIVDAFQLDKRYSLPF